MTKTESKIIPPIPNTVRIMMTCPVCGKVHDIVLPMDTYSRFEKRFETGEYIQDIIPGDENETLREKLLTRMCEECQVGFFNESEWEDSEDDTE